MEQASKDMVQGLGTPPQQEITAVLTGPFALAMGHGRINTVADFAYVDRQTVSNDKRGLRGQLAISDDWQPRQYKKSAKSKELARQRKNQKAWRKPEKTSRYPKL
jgi:hypothetical protein